MVIVLAFCNTGENKNVQFQDGWETRPPGHNCLRCNLQEQALQEQAYTNRPYKNRPTRTDPTRTGPTRTCPTRTGPTRTGPYKNRLYKSRRYKNRPYKNTGCKNLCRRLFIQMEKDPTRELNSLLPKPKKSCHNLRLSKPKPTLVVKTQRVKHYFINRCLFISQLICSAM